MEILNWTIVDEGLELRLPAMDGRELVVDLLFLSLNFLSKVTQVFTDLLNPRVGVS